jgi:hypothetical protein
MQTRGWGCGSVVQCLPSMHKALGSTKKKEKKREKKKVG